jgi:hypothetical protein
MCIARYLTLAVLALGISAGSAQAAPITLKYDFVAAGFFPGGAPVDPVTGSFSVTFDDTSTLVDVTTGISITNLNISLDSSPAFTYFSDIDRLVIGGLQDGALIGGGGSNDFHLGVDDVSTNPAFLEFWYVQTGKITFTALSGILTPSAVPEPATFSLFALGLVSFAAAHSWHSAGHRKRVALPASHAGVRYLVGRPHDAATEAGAAS